MKTLSFGWFAEIFLWGMVLCWLVQSMSGQPLVIPSINLDPLDPTIAEIVFWLLVSAPVLNIYLRLPLVRRAKRRLALKWKRRQRQRKLAQESRPSF